MQLILVFFIILGVSIILAVNSMKDFDSARDVRTYVRKKKKGTIVFFKDKVKHYSS